MHNKSLKENAKIGKVVILPSSFEGSAENLKKNFINSTILVQKFEKLTYFLMMICNGKWPEILYNIGPHESINDQPDIAVKVFEGKLEALIHDLTGNHVLEKIIAYTHVIEFHI